MKRLAAHVCLASIAAALLIALASHAAVIAGAREAHEEEGDMPVTPFNGKDLSGWKAKRHGKNRSRWTVGTAKLDPNNPAKFVVAAGGNELINASGRGVDIYSEYLHGDAVITLEVMVPRGSNSGIYVMGEYEVQVLDSFGRDDRPGAGDMGAIYGARPPKNPKYKAPGEWQQFAIHFLAPRFNDAGKKTANAKFVKVVLNGRTIHENVEMKGPTPAGVDGREKPRGPLMFQGDHGPVAYRNIRINPLKR